MQHDILALDADGNQVAPTEVMSPLEIEHVKQLTEYILHDVPRTARALGVEHPAVIVMALQSSLATFLHAAVKPHVMEKAYHMVARSFEHLAELKKKKAQEDAANKEALEAGA